MNEISVVLPQLQFRIDPRFGGAAAQQMVQESDRARAKFTQALGAVDWTDARGYDLALDTAAMGIEGAVDLIVQAATARVVTAEAGTASTD